MTWIKEPDRALRSHGDRAAVPELQCRSRGDGVAPTVRFCRTRLDRRMKRTVTAIP